MSSKLKKPPSLTEYEKGALAEIHQWKQPKNHWLGRTMKAINRPMEKAGDLIMATPGIGWAIERSFSGLVELLNNGAGWSVRPAAVIADYQKAGHDHVAGLEHIADAPLEVIDRRVVGLANKYKGIALAGGAASGAVGLLSIPADVVGTLSINLRAIGEYATYYGFDIQQQSERLFIMNILAFASSSTESQKHAAMERLVEIAKSVAGQNGWSNLQKRMFSNILKKIARSLGMRLTKAKLAQVFPVAGVAVGSGFNAYFTGKVCEIAYHLYRERYLARKYGESMIDNAVAEAASFDLPAEKQLTEKPSN